MEDRKGVSMRRGGEGAGRMFGRVEDADSSQDRRMDKSNRREKRKVEEEPVAQRQEMVSGTLALL